MFWKAVVLFLQIDVFPRTNQQFIDSCFVGSENQLNFSLSTSCPLIPRTEFSYESSCSVFLDKNIIENRGCGPCYWKEKLNAMCYPTENPTIRHCCCRTPDCNKRLIEDSVFGWSAVSSPDGSCDSVSLMVNGTGVNWIHRPPEQCQNDVPLCVMRLKFLSDGIASMDAGCLRSSGYKNEDIQKCHETTTGHMFNHEGNEIWCCRGMHCSRELYQQHVFERLQDVRIKDENAYLELTYSTMTMVSEHVWSRDRSYINNHEIFETVTYAFTALYLTGLYYIYSVYKPKNMEKLSQPPAKVNKS
ncbi:hypothetical protein RB195_012783 [Necator americanus]|uniref:Uncharacterized protein n=1 Tax=Necator americanus TaxID=51031 RepID=A0ABR1DSJ9_NECAM